MKWLLDVLTTVLTTILDVTMRYILLGLLAIFLISVLVGMAVEWWIGRKER